MNPAAPIPYSWAFEVAGWAVGAVAFGLLLWALLRDRARGRLRCPKCWYDVASLIVLAADAAVVAPGAPLVTCPECGFAATRRKQLTRTRPRRRWVVVALVMGLGAWVLYRTPALSRNGWPALIPTTALVYFAPAEDWSGGLGGAQRSLAFTASGAVMMAAPAAGPRTWSQQLGDEAWRRLRMREMWLWQSTALLDRHFAVVGEDPHKWLKAPGNWPAAHDLPVAVSLPDRNGPVFPMRVVGREVYGTATSGPWVFKVPAAGRVGRAAKFELELGDGVGTLWSKSLPVACDIVATAQECIVPVNSPDVDGAVAAALSPRLVREVAGFAVECDDRSDTERWRAVDVLVGYRIEIVLDGQVLAGGKGYATWQRPVFKDWDEVEMSWAPGANERLAGGIERAQFRVTGDAGKAVEAWSAWPFLDPKPRAWMGSFICPAEVKPRRE